MLHSTSRALKWELKHKYSGPGNQQLVLRHARGVSARSQSSDCVAVIPNKALSLSLSPLVSPLAPVVEVMRQVYELAQRYGHRGMRARAPCLRAVSRATSSQSRFAVNRLSTSCLQAVYRQGIAHTLISEHKGYRQGKSSAFFDFRG